MGGKQVGKLVNPVSLGTAAAREHTRGVTDDLADTWSILLDNLTHIISKLDLSRYV
jgi:hypothetical protein